MNAKEQLCDFLRTSTSLTPCEVSQICSCFNRVVLKSNTFFQQANSPVIQLGYVVRGLLRVYTIDEKGREPVRYFLQRGHFFCDFDGFFFGKPAGSYIQSITPCHLLVISLSEVEKLKKNISGMREVVDLLSQIELLRIIDTQFIKNETDPAIRHAQFLRHFPDIANRIPLKIMADYLHISLSSLCRIRRKYPKYVSFDN
jgi:CRP-like cAMP-binding protein